MKKTLILITIIFLLTSCTDDSSQANKSTDAVQKVVQPQLIPSNKSLKREKINYSDLTEFKVLSITEGLFENAPALQVNLTLPVDGKQDVDSLIKVFTGKESNQLVKGGWIYDENTSSLYFPFIEADTHYKILVDKDLIAVNGKKVKTGFVKDLNTRPYQKSVRFVSKGSTLLKDSNVLPIEAVNVEAVDLKFWRINPDKYAQFLQMSYRNEIYTLERMYKIAKVVYTAQFELNSEKNKREQHDISIKGIEEVQKAGLYFVTMMPHDMYAYNIQNTWFVSTDIGLHTRKYDESLVVFTHQLPQAQAYENIAIKLVDKDGGIIEETHTDAQGFAEIKSTELKKARFVLAQKGDNFNIVRLNQPKMDLSEFNLSSRPYHPQEFFLYAPRDLYRPGETININGLLRDADGKKVKASPIKVEIKRPDYRSFKTFTWTGDDSSLYTSQFAVPKDALTGEWTFIATLGNSDKFEYKFSVEDFLPERLKLDLKAENNKKHIAATANAIIDVQSDYLYGSPASNNRFDATVSVSSQTRLFDEYKDYEFGSRKYHDYDLNFDVPQAQLDANGFAQLSIKNQWKDTKFPLRIKTFVNVYESGGRPISRSVIQTIWPQKIAIGVRPSWLQNDADYASPNSNNEIELIAVNQQGEKVDMNNVDVLLIRENDQRYWHWGDDGWSYNRSETNVAVFDTVVNLKKNQINKVTLPVDYGNYRVEIRDAKQTLISSYQFFSGWSWYNPSNANGERPDQVQLSWNSDTITQGTDAELSITAPYAGLALITVESDKILYKNSIQLNSAQQTVTIPIDNNWNRHDLHASVMVIQKGDSKRKHLPARSFGVIALPLNRDDSKIALEIENPEKILPESTVTITVKAKNLNSPSSYVTLAAVDTGVLNVSNFKTPDPFAWLFAARKYSAELRDMYGSIIAYGNGKSARQKFGGDEDINRGGDAAQSDVQIVSLFHDKVAFDANGEAQIKLDIPYFNGEIRLMAMAYNAQQVAGVESRMKVAAPIVVSSAMPRFLAKGDESFAVIDVQNTEDFAQKIQLNLTADKYLGEQQLSQTIELQAQEKRIIKLPIKATTHRGLGAVTVKAQITGKNNYSLERDWKLGIRPASAAVTTSQIAVIEPGKSVVIAQKQIDSYEDDGLKSILKVSNSPVLDAQGHLHKLIQYPYGCLEQTTSRAWPLLQVEQSDLNLFDNKKSVEILEKRSELVENAISRIVGMQRYDGSFGLWNNNSPEERWLTVYASDFLLKAKTKGYNVPESVLEKAIKRMRTYVRKSRRPRSDLAQYLSSKEHYLVAYKAYAAYVLAGIKQLNLQDVRQAYDKQAKFSKTALPLAHFAAALELMGDERRANEAWLKAVDFKTDTSRYYYYGDYGTTVRDLSQVILLGMDSLLAEKLAKTPNALFPQLLDELTGKRWMSTQERGSLFRLAKALEKKKNNQQWSLDLNRNNHTDSFQQIGDLSKIWFAKDAKQALLLKNTGQQTLFIDYKTQGYRTDNTFSNNGIIIKRHFYDTKGNKKNIKQLKTGEMILVHVEVSLDKKNKNRSYLPDAMMIELLPAGLELENQNLEHSFKLDDIKIDKKYIYQWQNYTRIKHQEFRDDRYIAAVALSKYRTSHIFYLARAVTPGKYTIPSTLVEDMYHPDIRAVSKEQGQIEVVE